MTRAQHDSADLKRRCEGKLGIVFRDGKEFNGWFIHNGKKICRITVPKERKPLKPGTFGNMARQLNISAGQLDDLVQCPFGLAGYLAVLRERAIVA